MRYIRKKKEAVPLPLIPRNIAIEAKITYFLPYSKSAAQWPVEQHTKKPDLDNLLKFTLDACKDILYHDDAQILALSASKCYSTKPRTEIFFMEINWNDTDPKLKKILEEFSPEDAHSLHCLTSQLDALCFQLDQDFDPKIRTQTAALLIKKIADNYGKKLAKIQKIIDKFD